MKVALQSSCFFVKDKKGHGRRYAIDSPKIQTELGWEPVVPFEESIRKKLNGS